MEVFFNRLDHLFVTIFLAIVLLAMPIQAATEEEIQASIDAGIEWLVSVQYVDGSWGGFERVAHTGFAVMKLEDRAFEMGYSPFDPSYPYHENVVKGLNYIFNYARAIGIGVQPAGDPDVNGNGLGVYISDAGHPTYATSIALMAIVGSRDPSRIVTTGALAGWTYGDVVQDVVDYLAYGQNEGGVYRGGWGYTHNTPTFSDNSNSGYAVLGLDFAQTATFGFNAVIPQFVKDELSIWIDYIQNDANGGSGYNHPNSWVNVLKTGNLIYQMAFYGDDTSVQRVIDAVNYIETQWNTNNSDPGFRPHHYQAMYCMMKGFERMGIDIISIGGIETDWFDEISTIIVNTQQANGSWPRDYWGDEILSAGWALLTLEKVVPDRNIFVYLDIKPQSCPNPLNTKKKGVLPIAILGTEDFDVTTIDPSSVLLEGISPLRWNLEDVATPSDGEECECTTEGADGFMDLTLKFEAPEIVSALGDVTDRELRSLLLTGNLLEEFGATPIEGTDCVIILVKTKLGKQLAANLSELPEEYTLFENYPNPFNPNTNIQYAIPEQSFVKLDVYNSLGEEITTLVSEEHAAGVFSISWNAKNLPSGIYFYKIQAGEFVDIKKMLLMK
jgi:Secretion system C-terminal sorting domain